MRLVERVRAVLAARDEHELYTADEQMRQRFFDFMLARDEFELLVRDLDHVRQRQKFQHRVPQRVAVVPQREAQVGIEADDPALAALDGDGRFVRTFHREIAERHAAKMQREGVVKVGRVNVVRRIQHIGGGIAVKRVCVFTVGVDGDERERGIRFARQLHGRRVNAVLPQLIEDLVPERVVAELR